MCPRSAARGRTNNPGTRRVDVGEAPGLWKRASPLRDCALADRQFGQILSATAHSARWGLARAYGDGEARLGTLGRVSSRIVIRRCSLSPLERSLGALDVDLLGELGRLRNDVDSSRASTGA